MAEETITIYGNGAGTYTGNLVNGTTATETVEGTSGNDIIVSGAGNDLIEGGEGNDILIGGSLELNNGNPNNPNYGNYDITNAGGQPADTFAFNFNIVQTEAVSLEFRDGNTPNYTANQTAWDNYQDQLAAWRAEIEETYGVQDSNLETESTDVYTSATRSRPSTLVGTETYDNTYTIGGGTTITSTDGDDTILDFQWETDSLDLGSVTEEQFLEFFSVAEVGGNTVISLNGGGWSVTLLGVDQDYNDINEIADYIFSV